MSQIMKESLDELIAALTQILKEAVENPGLVKRAPHTMPVNRPDEVQAARNPILSWKDYQIDSSR